MAKSGRALRPSGTVSTGRRTRRFGKPTLPGRGTGVAGILLAALLATACEPTINTHGHVWRGVSAEDIQPGVDTRTTILQQLGSPTAEGLEQGAPWIYVTEREMTRGARSAISLEQLAVVIRFDSEDRVVSVETLGPEDRLDIEISSRETTARGRELTLLQQLLGNIGRFEAQ